MNEARLLGRSTAPDRDLYLARTSRLSDWPAELAEPNPHFVVFLAMDARAATEDEIAGMAQKLLAQGMAYLCAWGADSERVHDIFDGVRDDHRPSDGTVVMTTWHADESLGDALWFALYTTLPDDAFADSCKSMLAVVVDNDELADEIAAALSDVDEFNRRTLN